MERLALVWLASRCTLTFYIVVVGNGGGSDAMLVSFTLRLYRILGTSRASQDTESSAEVVVE